MVSGRLTPTVRGFAIRGCLLHLLDAVRPLRISPELADALTGLSFGHVLRDAHSSPLPRLPGADEVH